MVGTRCEELSSAHVANQDFASTVADAVLKKFASLPKTGKPQSHEHTVVAGFVITRKDQLDSCKVVALGSGTKCLSAAKRSSQGDVLNDSHAEVIARRALLAWLHQEMMAELSKVKADAAMLLFQKQAGTPQAAAAQTPGPGIFDLKPNAQFELQSGIQLHMFVSQPPCGDACICNTSSDAQLSNASSDAQLSNAQSHATACAQPAAPQLSTTGPVHSRGQCAVTDPAQSATGQLPVAHSTAVTPEEDGSPNLQSALPTKSTMQDAQTSALGLQHCQKASTGKRCSLPSHTSSKHPAIRTGAKRITPTLHPARANSLNASSSSQTIQPSALQPATVPYEEGQQATGVLRRKPGRGDATLSMSCSDKLAKWCCLGVQGSLLMAFLHKPVYLSTLVVLGHLVLEEGFDATLDQATDHAESATTFETCTSSLTAAVIRAVAGRTAHLGHLIVEPFAWSPPAVYILEAFPVVDQLGLAASAARRVASGVSINWLAPATNGKESGGCVEVTLAADGRKAGTNKKGPAWKLAKTASRLCKAAMLQRIKQVEAGAGFTPTTSPIKSISRSCDIAVGFPSTSPPTDSTSCDIAVASDDFGNMQPKQDNDLPRQASHTTCAESTAQVAEQTHIARKAVHETAADAATGTSYAACKQRGGSAVYMRQWCSLCKYDIFRYWIEKPQHLQDFTLLSPCCSLSS